MGGLQWGSQGGEKSEAEAATTHKRGPVSVTQSLSHMFAKHHKQRPKETVCRCSRLRGGSVNAPSETPSITFDVDGQGYRCVNAL